MLDGWNEADQRGFYVLVVPDETNQKFIAEMQQFHRLWVFLWHLTAIQYKLEYLKMYILSIHHTLLHSIAAGTLISEIDQFLLAKLLVHAWSLEWLDTSDIECAGFVFDDLAHGVDDLHDASVNLILPVEGHVIINLILETFDFDQGLILHDVELVLLELDVVFECDAFSTTHEDLLAKTLYRLLVFEQHSLHDGDGSAGQLGIVVFGQLNHVFDDGGLDQRHVFARQLLDKFDGKLVIDSVF